MLSQRKRKKQAEALARRALQKHGEMKHRKSRPPLNQLILSLLYHMTSVRRATRALRALKHAFVDWNELRVSHPCEVAAAISSAPWARDAAERLVWLLHEVYEHLNRTNLDFLHELTGPQARSCLQSLPTVNRPLADEVLLLSLDVPVLPCTAGAARMCHRLGLIESPNPTLKSQRALAKTFDGELYVPLHLYFCDVAEAICRPDEPLCRQCPMRRTCPSRR